MAITINGDGTLTGISVGGLPDGIVDTDMLATDAVSAAKLQSTAIASGDLPTGSILQVKTTTKTDTQASATGGTYTDVSGLSVAITPSSTSNTILVIASVNGGVNSDRAFYTRLVRDSTAIGVGDAAGGRVQLTTGRYLGSTGMDDRGMSDILMFVDSPSTTSETTYKVQVRLNGNGTFYINRREVDTDNGNYYRAISTITVMEVQG